MAPCRALAPYRLLDGPRATSTAAAWPRFTSNRLLTLQNPAGRIGTPSSRNRKAPQAPAPVSTGERMAVRCSCPLPPWLIQVPGTAENSSPAWVGRVRAMSAPSMRLPLPAAVHRPRSRGASTLMAGRVVVLLAG